jgi:hypothetical protein
MAAAALTATTLRSCAVPGTRPRPSTRRDRQQGGGFPQRLPGVHDFEARSGKGRRFFEVKATSDGEMRPRHTIELGLTEIAPTEQCKAEKRTHYRVLYIVDALHPERARLVVLLNPRNAQGLAFYAEQGAGVRFRRRARQWQQGVCVDGQRAADSRGSRTARPMAAKATEWEDLVKIGRTHTQDATPITARGCGAGRDRASAAGLRAVGRDRGTRRYRRQLQPPFRRRLADLCYSRARRHLAWLQLGRRQVNPVVVPFVTPASAALSAAARCCWASAALRRCVWWRRR